MSLPNKEESSKRSVSPSTEGKEPSTQNTSEGEKSPQSEAQSLENLEKASTDLEC